jgi:hypothetical protein
MAAECWLRQSRAAADQSEMLRLTAVRAQEAEGYRSLIKTPDRISERPPRGGLFFVQILKRYLKLTI